MLFGSHFFLFVFLPCVFAGFFIAGRLGRKWAIAWLAAASLAFYGWWNPRFVLLLTASIAVNYVFGIALAQRALTRHGRLLLWAAIAFDLAILAIFKYANFFLATVDRFTGATLPSLDIALPVGISFFTFTQIAFLVDSWRGLARRYAFADYLLFVSYFPHLVAGPILHHAETIPQFAARETFAPRLASIAQGTTLFAIGLAKKLLLADPLGEGADAIFNGVRDGATPHLLAAWAGALAYSLQLYFDFSGYSDMAIGLSLLFNIRLPINFDSPYKAASIIDFWRRWHMTLSRFLRDYLYIPLGGNRHGATRRYLNVVVTMLLGGLWHGASWTFVAWGAMHGAFLMVNHAWRSLYQSTAMYPAGSSFWRVIGRALTFIAVLCAWIVFRAEDFGTAGSMLAGMAGVNGVSLPQSIAALVPSSQAAVFKGALYGFDGLQGEAPRVLFLLVLGLLVVCGPNSQSIARYAPNQVPGELLLPRRAIALVAGVLLAFAVMAIDRPSAFLYYQF